MLFDGGINDSGGGGASVFVPVGGGIYGGYNDTNVPDSNYGINDDIFSSPSGAIDESIYSPSTQGNIHTPNVTVTGQGTQILSTNLDKILNTALSGLALLKGAKSIPTTVSGDENAGGLSAQQQALLQYQIASQQNSGGNLSGSLQNLLQQHPTEVLLIGVVAVAFLMKPPRISR